MYLNPQEFQKEVLFSQKQGRVSDKLGEMFRLLADNLACKGCFHSYTYIEDMKSNAVLGCIERFKKFNPDRSNSNVFSFFSRITYQGFLRFMSKEKKHQDLMRQIREVIQEIPFE